MFRYLSADIESTVVLNWAMIAHIGVSLGLTTFCLHNRGSSSKYSKYLTLWLAKFNSVVIRLGSDKYCIDSLHVVASSWKTSSVTRVSIRLRNVMFGHWLVRALTSLSLTHSVAKLTFSMVVAKLCICT